MIPTINLGIHAPKFVVVNAVDIWDIGFQMDRQKQQVLDIVSISVALNFVANISDE